MRIVYAALLSLLAPISFAQTVSDSLWTLNGGAASRTGLASQAACITASQSLPAPAPGATLKATCTDTTTITFSTPLPTASVSGAFITGLTSANSLTDTLGTAWTLKAGVVYEQPVASLMPGTAGVSAGVSTLLWSGGKIHQRNAACLWWYWSASVWVSETAPTSAVPSCGNPSPSGTVITSGQTITDAANAAWTIQNGVVYSQPLGGTAAPAGFSANVIALAYVSGKIYQENTACQWYGWTASATTPWVAAAAPVSGPNCGSSSSSSSGGSSSSSSSSGGSSSGGSSGSGFGIKVNGAAFTDLSGNILQLQGENVTGLEISYAPNMWDAYYTTTVAQWSAIKAAWHMNIIRVPINEWAWGTAGGAGAPMRAPAKSAKGIDYRTIVDTVVANITAAGMYVDLDLHWAAPNAYTGSLTGNNSPGYADGQPNYIDADNGPAFWSSIATVFKGNPAVMFELFNEPYGDNSGGASSYQYLKNGSGTTQVPFLDQAQGKGTGQNTGKTYAVVGHQQLVTAIRATGATNVILYSCPAWDSEPSQSLTVKPTDPLNQLGATVHYANGSNADYSNILNAGVPIIMTEFYTLASRGGYPWAKAAHIGYVMWGANNWNSNADLSSLINASPWSFNSASVAWQ